MPAKPMSNTVMLETIRRVEDCLREGFAPPHIQIGRQAIGEAADRALREGWVNSTNTFRSRIRLATEKFGEPQWDLYRAPVYQRPARERRPLAVYEPAPNPEPDGRIISVCVIGDCHDDPRLPDKTRFTVLGKWCRSMKPDYIVQLGDWATFDSFSRHTEQGSYESQLAPTWKEDHDSLIKSLDAFDKGLGKNFSGRKWITEGNHENRAGKFENSEPRLVDSIVPTWRSEFEDRGWLIRDYGEYLFLDGVGFIHHPINGAGKSYGGVTGGSRTAADSTFSIVSGHTHRLEFASRAKIGPSRNIEAIQAGCALPWGHVEGYAKLSATGWSWGALHLRILNGDIIDKSFTSMLTLMREFG